MKKNTKCHIQIAKWQNINYKIENTKYTMQNAKGKMQNTKRFSGEQVTARVSVEQAQETLTS